MADKKGVILIRFPDDLADKLRRASFELNIPIKDIVSQIVEENLEMWFGSQALEIFGKNVEMYEKFEKVLGKRETDQAFVEKVAVKLKHIKESQKYLAKAAKLISHGVLPMELLFEEDSASSEPSKPSRRASNRKETE
jgi:hypothetical protein